MKKQNKIILLPLLILISGCSYQGAMAPDELDPYEKTNRAIFEFNEDLDKAVLEPVADGYDVIIPEPVQSGFINFFNNAQYPITITNLLLQGKPLESIESLFRFTINSTFGNNTAFGNNRYPYCIGTNPLSICYDCLLNHRRSINTSNNSTLLSTIVF